MYIDRYQCTLPPIVDIDDATAFRYIQRAEEVRIIAESMVEKDAKAILLKVADEYIRMAESMRRIADTRRSLERPVVPRPKFARRR